MADDEVGRRPSRTARGRLRRALRARLEEARLRLEEASLRAESHALTGNPDGARDALGDQRRILADLEEELRSVVAGAAVEREAEQVVADAEAARPGRGERVPVGSAEGVGLLRATAVVVAAALIVVGGLAPPEPTGLDGRLAGEQTAPGDGGGAARGAGPGPGLGPPSPGAPDAVAREPLSSLAVTVLDGRVAEISVSARDGSTGDEQFGVDPDLLPERADTSAAGTLLAALGLGGDDSAPDGGGPTSVGRDTGGVAADAPATSGDGDLPTATAPALDALGDLAEAGVGGSLSESEVPGDAEGSVPSEQDDQAEPGRDGTSDLDLSSEDGRLLD